MVSSACAGSPSSSSQSAATRVRVRRASSRLKRRQARGQQRDELAVPALPLVETFERARELRVAGPELVQLLQVLDGAVGPVGEVLRGLRGVLEQGHRFLGGRRSSARS